MFPEFSLYDSFDGALISPRLNPNRSYVDVPEFFQIKPDDETHTPDCGLISLLG